VTQTGHRLGTFSDSSRTETPCLTFHVCGSLNHREAPLYFLIFELLGIMYTWPKEPCSTSVGGRLCKYSHRSSAATKNLEYKDYVTWKETVLEKAGNQCVPENQSYSKREVQFYLKVLKHYYNEKKASNTGVCELPI
jgi:hypothetical protein